MALKIVAGTLLPYGGLSGGFECNQSKLQLKNLNFEVKLVPYALKTIKINFF
jgi:hypothetical protein